MMYIHPCVVPAVVLLVATFCGIKICGPAQAQSTGNILATASASLPSKPSPSMPVLLPSTLPFRGLPDEANDTGPSSDPQPLPTEVREALISFLMSSMGWNCTPSIEGAENESTLEETH
ncbi:uncharacterized protein [Montipora capricornis]|uniref:uncharacterized protein n=1 Tax=Montipora capricornis TaxID=246305 RepID=UPI0035F132FE